MRIKLDDFAIAPERAHATDAGLDLRTPIPFRVYPGSRRTIQTGVHVELPPGTVGLIKSKSGLNRDYGITCEGVIDEGYTGGIAVILQNNWKEVVAFNVGDKIAQLLVIPCLYESIEIVEELKESDRGDKGFGSTGR